MEQEKKSQELTYDQLKAYVVQMESQAREIYLENQRLRNAFESKGVEFAFRCLDHVDLFSERFIKSIVNRIEKFLGPDEEETTEDSKEEK